MLKMLQPHLFFVLSKKYIRELFPLNDIPLEKTIF